MSQIKKAGMGPVGKKKKMDSSGNRRNKEGPWGKKSRNVWVQNGGFQKQRRRRGKRTAAPEKLTRTETDQKKRNNKQKGVRSIACRAGGFRGFIKPGPTILQIEKAVRKFRGRKDEAPGKADGGVCP